MKQIRLLGRAIRDAFKSVFRNFSLSIASISCITITLLIVSISIVLSYNIENIAVLIKKDFSIVVFVDNDATSEQIENIKNKIDSLDNIDTVVYETKEQVAESWKNSSQVFETIIKSWDKNENPLADTFSIKVKDVNKIGDTANQIKNIEKVGLVRYGEGIVEQLLSVLQVVEKVLIGIVGALVLVTIFLVSNTIKITIFSRRKEIEIMRLVGASNANIKMPFVIEGLILGILGSIIPIITTCYGYTTLYDKFGGKLFTDFIKLIEPTPFIYYVSIILVVIGMVVGMFGSLRAVKKHLKI